MTKYYRHGSEAENTIAVKVVDGFVTETIYANRRTGTRSISLTSNGNPMLCPLCLANPLTQEQYESFGSGTPAYTDKEI